MITKAVSSGQRTATATISEETKFVFSDKWEFYHVQNMGTGVAYVSMLAGATAGADGVIAVIAGGTACTMHNFPANDVYVTSSATTDKVQVTGSNSAISPFKSGGSGGGGSTYTLPQASGIVLGGIIAKAKTTETAECAIDTATGKMYAPASGGGVSETVLYIGSASTTGVTLSQAYTNFREIEISLTYTSNYGISTTRVHVADIGSGRPIIVPYVDSTTTDGSASSYGYARFYFSDATTFKSTVASAVTVRVRGIN